MSNETRERTTMPPRVALNLDKSTWTRVTFGDVAQASKEKVDPSLGGVERYIAGEHMGTDELKIHSWGEVGDGYLGPAFHRRFHPGQVLYGSRRTYLRKVAVAEFEGVCANTTFVVETKDSSVLLQAFLPFVMSSESFHAFAIQESKGSVNPYINWSDIARFQFSLPPLNEQRRLSDLLWSFEYHRQSLNEFLEKSRNAQGRLVDRLYRDESLTTLGAWVSRIEAGRSPSASPEPAMPGELGVLKVSAVGGRKFLPNENKRLHSMRQFREDRAVRAGDLLITRANAQVENVARACIVQAEHPNLMLSDKSLRLVPREGLPVRVILAVLRASVYRTYVHEVVNGTEAKNISQKRILTGPVPDVAPEVLATLNQMLLLLDSADEAVLGELDRLSILRGALMREIFEEDD